MVYAVLMFSSTAGNLFSLLIINMDRMLNIFKGIKLSDWMANQAIGAMIGHLVAAVGLNFLPGALQLYALQSSCLYCALPYSDMNGWMRQLLNIMALLLFVVVMCNGNDLFLNLLEVSQTNQEIASKCI